MIILNWTSLRTIIQPPTQAFLFFQGVRLMQYSEAEAFQQNAIITDSVDFKAGMARVCHTLQKLRAT